MAKLVNPRKSNVFALAFHVDYWDNLGWKDKFSNAAYTARQRLYASTEKSDGVYTPQAIVKGNIHMVGLEEKLYMQFKNRTLRLIRYKALEKLARANPDIRKKYSKEQLKVHIRKVADAQSKDIQSFKDYFLHLRDEPVWEM